MKILHSITTCDKNKDLQDAIRQTFANDTDSYVFVGDHFEKDMVATLGLQTGYHLVPFKIAFYIMSSTTVDEFDFFFFQDDDTFVDPKLLKQKIIDLKISPDDDVCLGKIFKDYTKEKANEQGMPLHSLRGDRCELPLDYPSGGAGFVLTKSCFNKVRDYLRCQRDFPTAYNGDISIGFWIRNSSDCLMIDCDKFQVDSQDFETKSDNITFHYMNADKMRKLYEIRK